MRACNFDSPLIVCKSSSDKLASPLPSPTQIPGVWHGSGPSSGTLLPKTNAVVGSLLDFPPVKECTQFEVAQSGLTGS